MKRSLENSEHYNWGDGCHGWILSQAGDLAIIQERMPPHTAERRHFHDRARQFFYILSGELVMDLEDGPHLLTPGSGIEVEPGTRHQARNESDEDVHFLVASSPTTRGDRVEVG